MLEVVFSSLIHGQLCDKAPNWFDALGWLCGFEHAEYIVEVRLIIADGEFGVEFGIIVLVTFDRDLWKERDSSIQVCYAGVIIQLSVYDLVLDYHNELIDLKTKFLSNPGSNLAKSEMIEDFAMSNLALLRVKPVVDLDLGWLHDARQVLKVVVAGLLSLQLLTLILVNEHA